MMKEYNKHNTKYNTSEEINSEDFFNIYDQIDVNSIDLGNKLLVEKDIDIKSFDDINKKMLSIDDILMLEKSLAIFRGLRGCNFLFRGLSDCNYKLLSTIARNNVKDYSKEKEILEIFKTKINNYNYYKYKLPAFNENLFYMSVGRHLGLWMRLLDWSASLWDALSFLVNENTNIDGVLYVLALKRNTIEFQYTDPFIVNNNVQVFREDYYIPDNSGISEQPLGILRRWRQHGFFTVQSVDCLNIPLDKIALPAGMELLKITIPKETKKMLVGYPKLSSKEWLYVNKSPEIINMIDELNKMYIQQIS